jgi:hypothetical protein
VKLPLSPKLSLPQEAVLQREECVMSFAAQDHNRQMDEVVAAYLKTMPASQDSRQELLGRYPHLALDLIDFFADYDHFESLVAPLRRISQGHSK